MQIGSSNSGFSASSMMSMVNERAERGPDTDNDGDEGGAQIQAAQAASASTALSSSGRGQKVNMLA